MSIFKPHLDKLSTYKPPLDGRDPERFALLDFNERTIPVSELIARDIAEWVMSGRLQMYPSYGNLEAQIAGDIGVADNSLMITNGSDQGIDLVFRACCREGAEVIVPGPSFPMYLQSASIENASIHEPVYTLEGGYPVDAVLALANENTRVIVVSNPNNPSGTGVSREQIVRLAEGVPAACILVDECYYEYCGLSVCDLVERFPNIVVTRTFSKTWGLPSLRIGYVVAAASNIETLLKVRGPYDVNQVAVVAVRSALKYRSTIDSYIDEVMRVSKPLLEGFLLDKNISFWPSVANFLWVFFEDAGAVELHLRRAGILVRPKADADGRMGLRITLGTQQQTQVLLDELGSCLV